MIAGSLRWRLLLAAAAAILLALAVAWVFMTLLFEWHLLRRLESEMTRDGARLAAALSIGTDGAPRVAQAPADSRLDTPAGGYYWQASSPGGVVRSRSLWDAELARVEDAPLDQWRRRQAGGPFGQSLVVVERRIRPDAGGAAVLVQLAQDDAPVRAARAEFGRELAAFLLLLWLVLLGAAWLQVRLGLAPLARVGRDLAALRDNAVARLPDPPLREIQPLADAINALADARGEELARARRRAADLAHSLKTPLAAMAAQSRRAREQGAAQAADGLDRAIDAVHRTVEAELARARIASVRRDSGGQAPARAAVERLVNVLEHTDRGGELAFVIEIPAGLQLPLHPEDLSELLGPVLENAVRYARRQVRIASAEEAGASRLWIEDDGPGIDAALTGDALVRGARLDEAGPGTGLGLAIAGELAQATGGRIALERSELGGLKVCLDWKRTG